MTRQGELLDLQARVHHARLPSWGGDEPTVSDALRWLEELLDILTKEEQ